ncbi:MAG: hypothetical protein U0792_14880 [Gemmataceae bacterium]
MPRYQGFSLAFGFASPLAIHGDPFGVKKDTKTKPSPIHQQNENAACRVLIHQANEIVMADKAPAPKDDKPETPSLNFVQGNH